ncbi:MAG: hypothetical protein E7159_03745 [Firmicutes bacterium]|nr:hypothetical protein [Bacillota bacterium]
MVDNISYLRSLKPKYNILIYLILISFSIIIISLFIFKIYDVKKIKGYVSCDDICKIELTVNYLDTNKYKNIDMIKINKENKNINNITVSDIYSDELTKNNYQIVTLEVDQLDDGILNTFIDVSLYSNKELIINKIINVLL